MSEFVVAFTSTFPSGQISPELWFWFSRCDLAHQVWESVAGGELADSLNENKPPLKVLIWSYLKDLWSMNALFSLGHKTTQAGLPPMNAWSCGSSPPMKRSVSAERPLWYDKEHFFLAIFLLSQLLMLPHENSLLLQIPVFIICKNLE